MKSMEQESQSKLMNESKRLRLGGAFFFVGGIMMLIAGFGLEVPLMVISGVLQLVAWFVYVTYANKREKEALAEAPVEA